jgi:leucyl/phenylalanyl-tRNA--protein transferase
MKISKSMKSVLRNPHFQFKVNEEFKSVIESCSSAIRKDQDGTWIHTEMKKAYSDLHLLGIAISAETYFDGELVGGLYGIKLGNVFFGESMFSKISNASKYALINFADYLHNSGVGIIDCQLETAHLLSLGAELISREKFLDELAHNL